MSDLRNSDRFGRDPVNNQTVRNESGWGWIAGLVVIVVVVVGIFAFSDRAKNGANPKVASNPSPAVTHMAPPIGAPTAPAPQTAAHP
jgi:hypothetical protein